MTFTRAREVLWLSERERLRGEGAVGPRREWRERGVGSDTHFHFALLPSVDVEMAETASTISNSIPKHRSQQQQQQQNPERERRGGVWGARSASYIHDVADTGPNCLPLQP